MTMDSEPPTHSGETNPHPPGYYSSLAPFRALFAQGNPVLTYHKLGPRPHRVRLKGLYLSANLFRQQLAELKAAGFTSGSLSDCAGPLQSHRIVLTFDDGYVNVLRCAVAPLAATGFRAIQFLPANLLGRSNEWDVAAGEAPEAIMDVAQVREWLTAGHQIGSHTLDHPYLTRIPLSAAREQIVSSKKKLEDLFGVPIEHFCYPYGDWNFAVRDVVAATGYRTACTTEAGVNHPTNSPFALKRFTARYPTRNWKIIREKLRRLVLPRQD
jgi:peptidoglycan/xylan/chitin deacetylase (PgdA/CDA1 family)